MLKLSRKSHGLKNPHLTVLLFSFYWYYFNWMWVEIILTAQLKKIHTWQFIINTWLLLLSEFWHLAFNIIFLNALFQLFCTLHKKIDKILRLLGARISSLLKVLLHVLHMRAMRSCYSMNNAIQWHNIRKIIIFLPS